MNEWISVKDKLPDLGQRVIATNGIIAGEAYLYGHSREFFRPYSMPWASIWGPVTHWMPMPELPQKIEMEGKR